MSYKQKFYAHLAIILVVLGALVFLSYFLFTLIAASGEAVVKAKEELALLLAKKNQIKDISKEYDIIKDVIPTLDAALLRKNDSLSFIMLVENLAAQTNVDHKIEAVTEDASSSSGGPPAALFNLNVTGAFGDVLKFIYLIENTKPYASIQTVQLSMAAASAQNSPLLSGEQVRAQTAVKVYTH